MSEPLATYTTYDGSKYEVLERPDGAAGAIVMRFTLTPDAGSPPPHTHPGAVETYEGVAGEFELLVGEKWRTVRAGESVSIPAGVRHTFRASSGAEVVIRNVHEPHHDFEAYIGSIAKLSQDLQITDSQSPGAAMRFAVLWGRHDDLIAPADLPLKLAFPILRGVARLTGVSVPD